MQEIDDRPASPLPPGVPPRPAAVLVPLILREDGLSVLFTQRTAHLSSHAGQISFPGGRVEDNDADAVATALRETWEEIGIGPESVRVLGRLRRLITGTNFIISPVVGLIYPPFNLKLDPQEVAEAFEVPLALLLDPTGHKPESFMVGEVHRNTFAIYHEGKRIWGATARILIELSRVLLPEAP